MKPQHTTPSPSTKPPLIRIHALHRELQAKKYPNCRKMAAKLEVSEKTIQRDIEFMRDQQGLPIEFCHSHKGYFYSSPVESLPLSTVTEGELVALLVAQKAIEQYRGTTYERTLSQAFAKLTDGLRDVITFDPAVMSDRVSFLSVGTSEPDIEIFRQLSHATIAQREVEFTYRKPGETAAVSRRVRPHHLACVRNLWYLIAWDCERHAMRTFALPRIAELKVTRQQFARENDFSPEAHFRDGFGIYSGGGSTQTVVLEFDAHAAALIQERSWHASQKFEPLPNGGVRLTLLLSRFEDLEGWILGWGRHVRVVAPSDLAEHIRGELHDAILGYDPNAKISRRHL